MSEVWWLYLGYRGHGKLKANFSVSVHFSNLLSPVLLQWRHLILKLDWQPDTQAASTEEVSGAEPSRVPETLPWAKSQCTESTLEMWTLHRLYHLDGGLGRILTSSRKKPGTTHPHPVWAMSYK